MISLSALARLNNNSTVLMEWCENAQRAAVANPLHLVYIPQWTGWEYPLEVIREHISLPANIQFYPDGRHPAEPYRLVTVSHQAPAIEGIPWTRTLYFEALKLADGAWDRTDYERAYLDVGKELVPKAKVRRAEQPNVLVHFCCPDHNTHIRDERSFCTRRVIRRLSAAGVHMKVITNDHNLTALWMQGLPTVQIVETGTAWTDMQLALGAAAIVQHASEGWSSYTSVPAMAKETPLINTYKGIRHRFDFFLKHGDLPSEFFSCKQIKRFVKIATSLA